MRAKKTTAAKIRDYLAAHPDARPRDAVAALNVKFAQVTAARKMLAREPMPAAGDSLTNGHSHAAFLDQLVAAGSLLKIAGSKENAVRLLTAVDRIRS
jgi:putative heme degradation protein